nr:hypothetical protein [Bacillus velezensis]
MMGITKVLSGAALGTIISISSLTSAHAAVIHKDDASADESGNETAGFRFYL